MIIKCFNCQQRASGYWWIHTAEDVDLRPLCAACGLSVYVAQRIAFTPSLRVKLYKSITTEFRADLTAPTSTPEKHWATHQTTPEATGIGRKPLSLLVVAKRRTAVGPSTVHNSILNQYRR